MALRSGVRNVEVFISPFRDARGGFACLIVTLFGGILLRCHGQGVRLLCGFAGPGVVATIGRAAADGARVNSFSKTDYAARTTN